MKEDKIRQELEEKLKAIGWSLKWCGCDNYRIINKNGQSTAFEYYNGELSVDRKEHVFGAAYGGGMHFNLSRCVIEFIDATGAPFVLIRHKRAGKKRPGIWVSFYG